MFLSCDIYINSTPLGFDLLPAAFRRFSLRLESTSEYSIVWRIYCVQKSAYSDHVGIVREQLLTKFCALCAGFVCWSYAIALQCTIDATVSNYSFQRK